MVYKVKLYLLEILHGDRVIVKKIFLKTKIYPDYSYTALCDPGFYKIIKKIIKIFVFNKIGCKILKYCI